jgi:hypothetical protein
LTIRTYSSPEAFKQALEQRLRSAASTGAEFARKRQLLVFDRFLARPTAKWTASRLYQAFPFDTAPRFLLRDRYRIYGAEVP